MTESEDPWADHIRGMAAATPLEEGNDPLSMPSTSAPTHSTPLKTTETRAPINRLASDLIEPLWERDSNSDVSNGVKRISPDEQLGAELSETPETSSATNLDASNVSNQQEEQEQDSEEEFVYPSGLEAVTKTKQNANIEEEELHPSDAPESRGAEWRQFPEGSTSHYANVSKPSQTHIAASSVETASRQDQTASTLPAKSIDYSELSQLCSQGPLSSIKSFFASTTLPAPEGSKVSAFALANEPNPASGLAPIHYASREGKVEILKWLIKEAGALVEMEDREGETALHKASLSGKLPALTFLLSCDADANCKDADGWTPLHNACSRGFLDIVKMLIENSGASIDVKGGRGSWTPLMNASSHGHLPIVRYLTCKQHADPFVRNAAGETAYDVAAATFEIYVCEVLERYESERWAALKFALGNSAIKKAESDNQQKMVPGQGPYNPLALHTTVPIILHENQRLDTRLSTLAIRGGKPRWSGTQAGRPDKSDRRAPGTMPPGPLSLSRTRNIPMRRDDVKLPTRIAPYKAKLTNRSAQIAAAKRARGEIVVDELASTPTPESVMNSRNGGDQRINNLDELSHFWLSDWQIDLTHPLVDAEQGWQYSQSLDTQEEKWFASPPAPLSRLIEGRGLGQSMQRAVILATSSSNAPIVEAEAINSGWVRRRRWVRVMRRRLDIEFGDGLEAAEQASSNLSAARDHQRGGILTSTSIFEAQQAARTDAEALGPEADYMTRSRALAGSSFGYTRAGLANQGEEDITRHITRLELAVTELRSFAFTDENAIRQSQAEELLKEYTLQLGYMRQAAGLEEGSEDGDDDDDDDEFIYPNSYKDDGQSIITRIGTPSVTTSGIVPPRIRSTPSEAGTSMAATRSADLANATEFRVPTNEVPNRTLQSNHHHGLQERNLLPTWEHDGDVLQCRGCNRRFTFFLRKHHCRRCGRIYCDGCSSHRAHLSPNELVIDPGIPEMMLLEASGPTRICDSCDAESRLPSSIRNARGVEAMSEALSRMDTLCNDSGISDISSRASELNDCPVCGIVLATLGESALQEEHIQACLENGGGGSVQGSRYLIYKLAEGPIVGKECQICLEDLCVGMTIARLPCLCYYHRHCIDSWFSRGRSCPVHARLI